MSEQNPNVANLVVAPIDTDENNPAIAFGGDANNSSGTGISGDYTQMTFSIQSEAIASVDADGFHFASGDIEIPGDLTVDGDAHITGHFFIAPNVAWISGAGAPIDGTTGDNFAGPGSLYSNTTDGELYIQTAVVTSPVWVLIGPLP